MTIYLAKDFSDSPGGRFKKEGKYSGEEFRETLLKPRYIEARQKGEKLYIDMDGCYGFPSSFIDESFGGLAKEYKNYNILKDIEIKCEDEPMIVDYIKECIKDNIK